MQFYPLYSRLQNFLPWNCVLDRMSAKQGYLKCWTETSSAKRKFSSVSFFIFFSQGSESHTCASTCTHRHTCMYVHMHTHTKTRTHSRTFVHFVLGGKYQQLMEEQRAEMTLTDNGWWREDSVKWREGSKGEGRDIESVRERERERERGDRK